MQTKADKKSDAINATGAAAGNVEATDYMVDDVDLPHLAKVIFDRFVGCKATPHSSKIYFFENKSLFNITYINGKWGS